MDRGLDLIVCCPTLPLWLEGGTPHFAGFAAQDAADEPSSLTPFPAAVLIVQQPVAQLGRVAVQSPVQSLCMV